MGLRSVPWERSFLGREAQCTHSPGPCRLRQEASLPLSLSVSLWGGVSVSVSLLFSPLYFSALLDQTMMGLCFSFHYLKYNLLGKKRADHIKRRFFL